MEKECISFELTLNDDEYLTSVFFEFSDGYFGNHSIFRLDTHVP